jgi:hypothetical protein
MAEFHVKDGDDDIPDEQCRQRSAGVTRDIQQSPSLRDDHLAAVRFVSRGSWNIRARHRAMSDLGSSGMAVS